MAGSAKSTTNDNPVPATRKRPGMACGSVFMGKQTIKALRISASRHELRHSHKVPGMTANARQVSPESVSGNTRQES